MVYFKCLADVMSFHSPFHYYGLVLFLLLLLLLSKASSDDPVRILAMIPTSMHSLEAITRR